MFQAALKYYLGLASSENVKRDINNFMKTFNEYKTVLDDQTKSNLELLTVIFKNDGLKVHEFLDQKKDPYIYVFNPLDDLSFQGVAVYKRGNILAYRPQRYEDSQPYGAAYMIPIQDIYEDYIYQKKDKKEALKMLCTKLCKDMRSFFRDSKKAEDAVMQSQLRDPKDIDGAGQIIIRNTGTDYSNTIYSTNRR